MSEITLEKIDIIRERTGAGYGEAKEALERCEGNVIDALIYLEENKKSKMDEIYTSKDEFVAWMKETIDKGYVSRIKVRRDDKVLLDVPVNAGVIVGALSIFWTPLLAIIGIGTVAAVATNLTIEITKTDGTVEVVNKIIKGTMDNVADKVSDMASGMKGKMSDFTSEVKDKVNDYASEVKDKFSSKDKANSQGDNVYSYTVKFDDSDSDSSHVD